MITIRQRDGCISITGHAKYAERGKDIVCAAVSTLVQVLISSVHRLTRDEMGAHMEDGKTVIVYRDLSREASLLMDSFFIGVEMIVATYPENVRVQR